MSQTTAMIVHHLMDMPDSFLEKNGVVSNGYYSVSLDGSRYGMGISMYQAEGEEKCALEKAMQEWKRDTGWQPEPVMPLKVSENQATRTAILPDVFIRQGYEAFARTIKSHHRSFKVHADSHVFSAGVQEAITKLDQIVCPMEKIEGRNTSAKEGGISGA